MKKSTFIAVAVAALGTVFSVSAYAGQQYKLKGDAPTGTLIPTVEAVGTIPFDKRYVELDKQQREQFRARFGEIANSVVPPFPRNGMQDVYRPLIEANDRAARGTLSVNVLVDEHGQVTDLEVVDSPSPRLSSATQSALRDTQFDPAICDGAPCAMEFPVQIKFL